MKVQTYKTSDLAQAAFLCSAGHWYDEVARVHDETRDCVWSFVADENLIRLVAEYRIGKALVDPKSYTQALAKVRNAMYVFLKGEG